MTDATLEAVRFAVGGITAGPEYDWCDNLTVALCTYFESHPGKPDTDEETEHGWHPWAEEQADSLIEAIAQAAIDAMPGWQPVTLTDIAVSGVRQAVHLQHEDLFVDYNKEGTFRLEFTQEQMRDLYNNIGAALHKPLPEPPE